MRQQIGEIRGVTDRPFAVGFITHLIPLLPDNFESALEEKVPVVAFSFSDPKPWIGKATRPPRISGRRPIRSARDPISGADRNAAKANDMVISPSASTPEPNSPSRLANTGITMPKPIVTMTTLAARSRTIFRARGALRAGVSTWYSQAPQRATDSA